VAEVCALLQYYAALNVNHLPMFWDNVSVPSSRIKKMGPICCPKTSVKDYDWTLCNAPEERTSHRDCDGSLKSWICGWFHL
jgi:hypothetical protein